MKIARMFPSIIFIITLVFTMFTNANCLNESEALVIGVEKYLEFLWMVDGAFNDSKYNDEFVVNGKKLDSDNKKFTCTYKNRKNNCIGNDFENEFKRVFASNITYSKVYGDGVLYTWFKYENGKYIFNYLNNCNTERMDINQIIKVSEITNNKIIYKVGSKEDNFKKTKAFVLIKENDDWKVSKAYYRDICEMGYNIE